MYKIADTVLDNRSVYALISGLSLDATRSDATFSGCIATTPKVLSAKHWSYCKKLHSVVTSWHRKCLDLLMASLAEEISPIVADSLLQHVPEHWAYRHHRRLPKEFVGTPSFYRTDQSAEGQVLEVQCPGSLWGVHEILCETYLALGFETADVLPRLSEGFASSLRARFRGETPIIHHLLDNASHPAGERFFIQRARRYAKYFSFDNDVRQQDCNFVRGHDYLSLLADCFAGERIQRLIDGHSVYDLPPVSIFDQKLLIAFPFWDETRMHFSDAIRSIFPYTTIITPEGLRLATGEWVSLHQFACLPRGRRAYFLKYAGSDNLLNWGSRAVFSLEKLSRASCEVLLRKVTMTFSSGDRWIVQCKCTGMDNVTYFSRSGEVVNNNVHDKYSVFYGPSGALGVLIMFEKFYKVHGSAETICTVGIPELFDSE